MSRGKGYGPSIVDGRIRYVSPSQLEKFDAEAYGGCARRWWFRYVAGKPEPEIKAQRLGTQVHSQIEHYLKTGENVLGPIALSGFRFLPKPKTVEIEVPIATSEDGQIVSGLDCADIPVVGYVDCVNASGACENDAGETVVESGVVEAIDWKTTKRIDDEVDPDTGIVVKKGLAKTAEHLSRTHQMVAYGEWLRRRFAPVRKVTHLRLSHGVFQTEGPRAAVKRSALVTVDEVRARWRRSENVAEKMKAAAHVEDVTKLPANLDSCSAYGGCPFRADCPREAKAILAAMWSHGGREMSLLDKINARKNGAAPVQHSAPVPDPATVAAEAAKLLAEEAALRTASVLPPDVPESTLSIKPAELVYNGAKAEEPVADPPKKTRKAKAEKAAAEVLETHDETFRRLASYPAGLTLYLDCHEDGVAAKRLEAYAQKLADELAAAAGAADIRCAPERSELSFGKWKGALAAVARATPPEPGAYTVSMSNEIAAVVAEALAPTAARVVRGRP